MRFTFIPPSDAFIPPSDAFISPSDAFISPSDAFIPPSDAFIPPSPNFSSSFALKIYSHSLFVGAIFSEIITAGSNLIKGMIIIFRNYKKFHTSKL